MYWRRHGIDFHRQSTLLRRLLNQRMREIGIETFTFLEEASFEVLALKGLRERYNWDIHRLPPSAAYRLTMDAAKEVSGADGVLISCGGLQTFEVIETLERDLGLPVVTSNQAALWAGLGMTRVSEPVEGYGRLLRMDRNAREQVGA